MNGKWSHVISEVDNWIWLLAAVGVFVVGKYLEITEMYTLAGACLVKVRGEKLNGNGSGSEQNGKVPSNWS